MRSRNRLQPMNMRGLSLSLPITANLADRCRHGRNQYKSAIGVVVQTQVPTGFDGSAIKSKRDRKEILTRSKKRSKKIITRSKQDPNTSGEDKFRETKSE